MGGAIPVCGGNVAAVVPCTPPWRNRCTLLPPGAASPPSSEVRVETPARRRPPSGYNRDYIP
ncbi:hypothetical protein T03_8116 [Trichinella britovi]|uniref:Uncharacterized protein n=1 Tax=Trichinella britovi TaxID=45882 RepID=A0A0V1AQ89_TRIBR|nr:hypothetical protein T03_8116 [Trichinella britovi]